MTSCGASAGGALTQLIALGAADKYLSQNPSITFWRFRYNKYTNFALEPIEQPFNTQVMFGNDTQMTFNRTGDLIFWTYVVIDLHGIYAVPQSQAGAGVFPSQFPGLAGGSGGSLCDPCGDDASASPNDCSTNSGEAEQHWAHYTNSIGQWLIRRAALVIGGQVIDTLYSDYLYMWEELSGKPGKRLREMVGKEFSLSELIEDSKIDRRLYVPLPFWFTATSGNALPVVSLQFHGIQLIVSFAELQTCVQTSCSSTLVESGSSASSVSSASPVPVAVLKTRNQQALVDQDLRAVVETTYVYLDIDERDRFATGSFEQLITQVQAYSLTTRNVQVRMALNFNHPIIELIWAVRRNCHGNVNNWFCYAGRNLEDPIRLVQLKLNNLPRFAPKEGRYFRLVQPYQHHTNIPQSHVYCWSAALYPEESQPSGSVNFSRIDNVELTFDMQENIDMAPTRPNAFNKACANNRPITGDFTVLVFARSWNILRYREGLGGLAYSN
jgi:hypothetical protein